MLNDRSLPPFLLDRGGGALPVARTAPELSEPVPRAGGGHAGEWGRGGGRCALAEPRREPRLSVHVAACALLCGLPLVVALPMERGRETLEKPCELTRVPILSTYRYRYRYIYLYVRVQGYLLVHVLQGLG